VLLVAGFVVAAAAFSSLAGACVVGEDVVAADLAVSQAVNKRPLSKKENSIIFFIDESFIYEMKAKVQDLIEFFKTAVHKNQQPVHPPLYP
jgi:hypothetical protein